MVAERSRSRQASPLSYAGVPDFYFSAELPQYSSYSEPGDPRNGETSGSFRLRADHSEPESESDQIPYRNRRERGDSLNNNPSVPRTVKFKTPTDSGSSDSRSLRSARKARSRFATRYAGSDYAPGSQYSSYGSHYPYGSSIYTRQPRSLVPPSHSEYASSYNWPPAPPSYKPWYPVPSARPEYTPYYLPPAQPIPEQSDSQAKVSQNLVEDLIPSYRNIDDGSETAFNVQDDESALHHVVKINFAHSSHINDKIDMLSNRKRALTDQQTLAHESKVEKVQYDIMQTQLRTVSDDLDREIALLTYQENYHNENSGSKPESRWIHFQTASMSLELFKMEILRLGLIPDDTTALLMPLFQRLQLRHEGSSVHGKHLEPIALDFIGESKDGETKRCSVAFVAFPYLKLDSPRPKHDPLAFPSVHPVRSLFQFNYLFDSTEMRDEEQIVHSAREDQDILCVPQIWMLLVNDDIILSMASSDISSLGGDAITFQNLPNLGSVDPFSQIRIIDPEHNQYSLPLKMCGTWFEFIGLFTAVLDRRSTLRQTFLNDTWKEIYELQIEGGESISEANWSKVLRPQGETNNTIIRIVMKPAPPSQFVGDEYSQYPASFVDIYPPRSRHGSVLYNNRTTPSHTDPRHRCSEESGIDSIVLIDPDGNHVPMQWHTIDTWPKFHSIIYSMMQENSKHFGAFNRGEYRLIILGEPVTSANWDETIYPGCWVGLEIQEPHSKTEEAESVDQYRQSLQSSSSGQSSTQTVIPHSNTTEVGSTHEKVHEQASEHCATVSDREKLNINVTPTIDNIENNLRNRSELSTNPETEKSGASISTQMLETTPVVGYELWESEKELYDAFDRAKATLQSYVEDSVDDYDRISSIHLKATHGSDKAFSSSQSSAGVGSSAGSKEHRDFKISEASEKTSPDSASSSTLDWNRQNDTKPDVQPSIDPAATVYDYIVPRFDDEPMAVPNTPSGGIDPFAYQDYNDAWESRDSTEVTTIQADDSAFCPIFAWKPETIDGITKSLAGPCHLVPEKWKDVDTTIHAILQERDADARRFISGDNLENSLVFYLVESSRDEVFDQLWRIGSLMTQFEELNTRADERQKWFAKKAVIASAIEIFDSFLPLHYQKLDQYWLTKKFWGAILHIAVNEFPDSYLESVGNVLSHFCKRIRQIHNGVAYDNSNQTSTYYLPKALVDAFNPLILYLCVCSQLGGTDCPEWNVLQVQAVDISELLLIGRLQLISMIRAGDFTGAKVFRRVDAQAIITFAVDGLIKPCSTNGTIKAPNEFGLLQTYRHYLSDLRQEVRQEPIAETFDRIQQLREELSIVSIVLDQQMRVLKQMRSVWTNLAYPGNQISIQRIHQSRRQLRQLQRDLGELEVLAGKTSTLLRSSLEVRKESNSQAIVIFTIVTVIFLPLSFISSYFGMNSVDIRDGTFDQSRFWIVALPITCFLLLLLWALIGLRRKMRGSGRKFGGRSRTKRAVRRFFLAPLQKVVLLCEVLMNVIRRDEVSRREPFQTIL